MNSTVDPTTRTQFHLANAWARRGNSANALAGYQAVLAHDPNFVPARVKLAELFLQMGRGADALEQYASALALEPGDAEIRYHHNVLAREMDRSHQDSVRAPRSLTTLTDHVDGKLNLNHQKLFPFHRSGWDYGLHALEVLHNSAGVLFDGFIENNFAWGLWTETVREPEILERMRREGTLAIYATSQERGITPYREPWVGVFHNPHEMPAWFHCRESPQTILGKAVWRESAEHCRGLFALSDHLAAWLRQETGLPVSTLRLPSEIPEAQFEFEKFVRNPHKKIVQVGWWLRRLSAIYQLPLARGNVLGYEKLRLVPLFFPRADAYLKELMQTERERCGLVLEPRYAENTSEVLNVTDAEFDELLAQNILLLELYDAAANNTIVECIARATPLLVNPLPAVVEYLGADYPFYFDTLEEAAAKALDLDLIAETHRYLKQCDGRRKLSADYFLESVRNSEVYTSL